MKYMIFEKVEAKKGISFIMVRIKNKKFKTQLYMSTEEERNRREVPSELKLPKVLLYDLYWNKKLSFGQIAKELNIGKTSVSRYLEKYKTRTRNPKEGQKLRLKQDGKFGGYIKAKLTKTQKQFLIGTLLGDGTLYLGKRNKNARLKVEHTEKDKQYLKFKYLLMGKFVTGRIMRDMRERKFDKQTRKYYSGLIFITTTHPEFTRFHKLFYKDEIYVPDRACYRKKIVTDEILSKLTPFGLAIWIMDDGYYNKKHKFMDLYTMNFTYKEHLLMQNWFEEKYSIFPKIDYHKQSSKYYLRFNLSDTRKLVRIIRPYVIRSMRRKVGLDF